MLMTTYSAGLRVSETTHLRVSDIDGKRMLIRVEQGKGKKDRYTLLSKELLTRLREYWLCYHPRTWLFPGSNSGNPIDSSTVQRVFKIAKKSRY
jgi:integrase